MKFSFSLLLLWLLIGGCANAYLQPEEYVQWVEDADNGLQASIESEELLYSLQYTPVDYLTIRDIGYEITSERLEKERKEREGLYYFTLRIAYRSKKADVLRYNLKEQNEYYYRLNYLLSGIPQDIVLIEEGDTLACTLHHYERTYGVSPFQTVVLAFEKRNTSKLKDLSVYWYDRMFSNKDYQFTIDSDNIKKLPQIQLN